MHSRFIFRELTHSKKQTFLFLLCVVLSIVTPVALNGYGESVNRSLSRDARRLHAGDIIIRSHYPLTEPVAALLDSLRREGRIEIARVDEFYSMVRGVRGAGETLLVNIKAVDSGYPFYGAVELESGRPFGAALTPGSVVVEASLLDRLGLAVGDRVRVGDATLTVRDVVVREPDRPMNFFSLGPRVFVAYADLESLGLVTAGSRVEYATLVKTAAPGQVDFIAARLKSAAKDGRERVETFRTAGSSVKRFFDNILFFLDLTGIFTLFLAGIGIQSAVTAFLKERETTIGTIKALGATNRFITTHFIIVLLIPAALGTLLGLGGGCILQAFLPVLFRGILPPDLALSLSGLAVLKGAGLGVLVTAVFAFSPLYRLKDFSPTAIFRKEQPAPGKQPAAYAVFGGVLLLGFTGIVLWQLGEWKMAAYFVLGVLLLLLSIFGLTHCLLLVLRKLPLPILSMRQAVRGLFRPGNSTALIVVTLTASLSVILTITTVERNLDAGFVQSYPENAPNLFFIDIQPSQLDDFKEALGMPAEYYPVVRARISSIAGKPIDFDAEKHRRGDNLAREFNLTYRDYLLGDEKIVRGGSLFPNDGAEVRQPIQPSAQPSQPSARISVPASVEPSVQTSVHQTVEQAVQPSVRQSVPETVEMSVLDTFASGNGVKLGDVIVFNIQGVPFSARVSSIRTLTKHLMQPFFYFVFPERVLKDAPRTVFTAVRVENGATALQSAIVKRFPNISVIDAAQTVAALAKLMRKLSAVARFFLAFSFLAGILVIISSMLATRSARIRQAAYYKILGARGAFVLRVFAIESVVMGLASVFLAVAASQAGSWTIGKTVLDIPYKPFLGASLALGAAALCVVVLVGMAASVAVLRQKPVEFLREDS